MPRPEQDSRREPESGRTPAFIPSPVPVNVATPVLGRTAFLLCTRPSPPLTVATRPGLWWPPPGNCAAHGHCPRAPSSGGVRLPYWATPLGVPRHTIHFCSHSHWIVRSTSSVTPPKRDPAQSAPAARCFSGQFLASLRTGVPSVQESARAKQDIRAGAALLQQIWNKGAAPVWALADLSAAFLLQLSVASGWPLSTRTRTNESPSFVKTHGS
ncbi:hypothetical protein GX51_06772 [Blastomyces parvus]|uniref:Uncharacterized protein n=1 Tax=Blastomyces parvus TaxID=2060905 RepID=A0A2B7WPI8_9EURO|nr:hypothetical protein GX51_06772 [Blastomyces parvus]